MLIRRFWEWFLSKEKYILFYFIYSLYGTYKQFNIMTRSEVTLVTYTKLVCLFWTLNSQFSLKHVSYVSTAIIMDVSKQKIDHLAIRNGWQKKRTFLMIVEFSSLYASLNLFITHCLTLYLPADSLKWI